MALYLPESGPTIRDGSKARIPERSSSKARWTSRSTSSRALSTTGFRATSSSPTAFGHSFEFSETVRIFGLDFAVAIHASTKVWLLDARDRRRGDPRQWADSSELGRRAFRKLTWRHGTKSRLSSRFVFRRVKASHDDGTEPATVSRGGS